MAIILLLLGQQNNFTTRAIQKTFRFRKVTFPVDFLVLCEPISTTTILSLFLVSPIRRGKSCVSGDVYGQIRKRNDIDANNSIRVALSMPPRKPQNVDSNQYHESHRIHLKRKQKQPPTRNHKYLPVSQRSVQLVSPNWNFPDWKYLFTNRNNFHSIK